MGQHYLECQYKEYSYCIGAVLGYQVLQYTELEVVTGVTTVHGQLVMVKVWL